jgi:hypothetical protein
LVAACDPGQLVALAISQGVAGRAGERLLPILPELHRSDLLARTRQEMMRHFARLGLLEKLGNALEEADVAWAVLKGPVLAEVSYARSVRGYSDLDLLVPARQLRRSIEALRTVGVEFAERNWPLLIADATGELAMAIGGAPVVDLHWHPVNKRTARQRFMLPADELLERRQPVQLGSVASWTLEPTDFAIHVALHASLSGAHQLRWLLDIERTVANQAPDWEALVRRCQAWRVGLPVSVALSRSRETVGAVVPEEVIGELAGGRLNRAAVRRLSRWVPAGHMPGGRAVPNGATRMLRDDLAATMIEFAGETWQTLGDLLHPGAIGPNDPRHLFYDSGGSAGFERYLEMVSATDRYGHLSTRELRQFALPSR